MDSDTQQLIARGDMLFGQRSGMLNFWQQAADHFFPERGQFTMSRSLGEEFADHLQTSYPLKLRRDLGNAISAMLRPRGQQWMTITVEREDRLDSAGREWLEYATGVQWRAMYDHAAQFVRATKEADHDFVTFGQCVITRDYFWGSENKPSPHLVYQCHHLKDCAWAENDVGVIDELHIRWQPTVQTLCRKFPKTVNPKVKQRLYREPFGIVNCRRVLIPSEHYQPAEGTGVRKAKAPYLSIYIDVDNGVVLEVTPRGNRGFTLPRWQTISGSAYAYSPAVVVALPDARLIQSMMLTLLEAGEFATRPALLANQNLIRSDLNYFPGGVTWAHAEGDQKLQEALQALKTDNGMGGAQFGILLTDRVKEALYDAWYLNKLALPPMESSNNMTKFETRERIAEWIRSAIPLFEPMETEYNADLCDGTFQDLMAVGTFGPVDEIPRSLQGENTKFRFESPLHENIERKNATIFGEAAGLVLEASELDPSSSAVMDTPQALRDALRGIGLAAKHIRDEETVKQIASSMAEARQQEQAMAQLEQGAGAAEKLGKAGQVLAA